VDPRWDSVYSLRKARAATADESEAVSTCGSFLSQQSGGELLEKGLPIV
jgi:hypothetical protein